eukprot:352514-Prymnesium_polylepis.2
MSHAHDVASPSAVDAPSDEPLTAVVVPRTAGQLSYRKPLGSCRTENRWAVVVPRTDQTTC